MILFHKPEDLKKHIETFKRSGKTVGFVPTMGALHAGHMSLIERSLSNCDLTICSIFVNPTQFNNKTDFEKYPKTTEQDVLMLEESGCDVLFLPEVDDMYPEGFVPKNYELGNLETILEGAHRPGHFQGVCMIVERLLNIVDCDILFLGRKDYQQCMVIQKLIDLTPFQIRLVLCETKREEDGLAMSSRNMRLNMEERQKSRLISEVLLHMKENLLTQSLSTLEANAKLKLENAGFEVDYVSITDEYLNKIDNVEMKSNVVGLIAASINGIRLIDNMNLN